MNKATDDTVTPSAGANGRDRDDGGATSQAHRGRTANESDWQSHELHGIANAPFGLLVDHHGEMLAFPQCSHHVAYDGFLVTPKD